MAEQSSGEKTEKPTEKRRKEARKEGQVPRTQDLGAWGTVLVLSLVLPMLVGRELEALRHLMARALRMVEEPTAEQGAGLLGDALLHCLVALLVLGSGVLVLGVAGAVAQGGFFLATKSVKPQWSKLNPVKGMKRIFGPQAMWEGTKMLIKATLVTILVYAAVRSMMPVLGGLVPISAMLEMVSAEATAMIRNVALAGVVMAGADYLMARRRIGKQTRMTKDEVRRENKQSEGDPLLKGARRSRALAISRNRMLAEVSDADVVLVNPTHVAVALRYQPEKGAPIVVARGAGVIATKIRERALAHEVPLVRDVPLARALHSATEVGQEIPAELFAAVAHVLAFVINRRSRGFTGGTHRSPRRETELPAVPAVGRRRRNPSTRALAGR